VVFDVVVFVLFAVLLTVDFCSLICYRLTQAMWLLFLLNCCSCWKHT